MSKIARFPRENVSLLTIRTLFLTMVRFVNRVVASILTIALPAESTRMSLSVTAVDLLT